MAKVQIVGQDSLNELKKLITEFNNLRETVTGVTAATTNFRKIDTALKSLQGLPTKLAKEWIELDNSLKRSERTKKSYITQTANLKKIVASLNLELNDLRLKYAQVSQEAKKADGATKGFMGSSSSLKNNITSLLGAFGIIQGFQMFTQMAKDAFNLTINIDSMAFSMKAVIKDVEELAHTQDFLRKITNDYGAELVTTTNRYIKFRAAATQANFTAAETQKIFSTMTKAAGVLGLKTDELTGVYLALEQMISKGKITTEELRRQLGERLPGAMDIMAKSMGVTTAQLDEMLKKGEVLTKDVLPGFADEVQKAFGLDSINRVETLQAAVVRLQNSFTMMVDGLNSSTGAGKKLAVVINYLADNMTTIVEVVTKGVIIWGTYRTALLLMNAAKWLSIKVTALLTASTWDEYAAKQAATLASMNDTKATAANSASKVTLTTVTNGLILRLRVLWATMLANPVGLFAAALAALVTTIYAVGKALEDNYDEQQQLNKEMANSIVTQRELEQTNRSLAARYFELLEEVKTNTDAQKELNDVVIALGQNIPTVVDSVDAYGRALALNSEELVKFLELENKRSELQAKVSYQENVNQLVEARDKLNELADAQNGLTRVSIKGIGDISKQNGKWMIGLKELSDEQKLLLIDYERDWKSREFIARENVDKIQKTLDDFDWDPTGEKRAAELLEQQKQAEAAAETQRKLATQTVSYMKEQIKELNDAIENVSSESLYNLDLTPEMKSANIAKIRKLQEEREDWQKKINELLGVEEKGRTRSIRALRELRDLQEEINMVLLKRRSAELKLRSNDDKLNFKTRKEALENYVEVEKEILQKASDTEIEILRIKINKEKALNKKDIDAGAKGSRLKELLEHNEGLETEFAQQSKKIEEQLKSDLIQLEVAFSKDKAGLLEEQNDHRMKILEKQFNEEIILIKSAYEDEVKIYNDKIAAADNEFENSKKRGSDRREHDKSLLEAKKVFAKAEEKMNEDLAKVAVDSARAIADAQIQSLQDLIDALDDSEGEFKDVIERIKAQMAEIEAGVPNLDPKKPKDALKGYKDLFAEILDMAAQFNQAIGSLVDEVFNRKIENINAEIEAEKNRYDELIKLAHDDKEQKESLQQAKDQKMKELEAIRLKEEQKQARAKKKFAIADIAISTAQAIMSIWAQVPKFDFGISAGLLTGMVGALGALQMAAVLAAPIPQYKDGGNIKKDEVAMINDGGKQEYVKRGNSILTTKSANAIVNLKKDDIVYKSYDDMVKKNNIPNFSAAAGMHENDFNLLMYTVSNGIEKGFKKAKIENNITVKNRDSSYRKSMSNWG